MIFSEAESPEASREISS